MATSPVDIRLIRDKTPHSTQKVIRKLTLPKRTKWLSIVGARPQFIKLAAVCRAINAHNQAEGSPKIEHRIVHTGQHYHHLMADLFFLELGIAKPRYNLQVGSYSHGVQLAHMLERLEPVLIKEKPDWVIVYGDTNSTAAGALLAARLGYAIAHVEAGCRSYNWQMPEEQNRVVADHLSRILLAPSQNAVRNLKREGVGIANDQAHRQVEFVGDVMYDVMLASMGPAERRTEQNLKKYRLKSKGYHLLTLHRAENTASRERLLNILTALEDLDLPVLFPMHPRTRKVLMDKKRSWTNGNLRITSPVGYLDMLALEKSACKVLTDSGGVQKEAFYMQVPCVTLRNETEWPETIELGANRLVGADREKIMDAVLTKSPVFPSRRSPFGDGKASERIVKILASASI